MRNNPSLNANVETNTAVFEQLKQYLGSYRGSGTNHDHQAFTADLSLKHDKAAGCFTLIFTARVGSELVHSETSMIGPNSAGGVSLWVKSNNHPAVLEHPLVSTEPFVFQFGNLEGTQEFREQISLRLLPNADLEYTYSWGLPGGEFKTRSSAKLIAGRNRPIPQAKLVETPTGLKPEGEGWYVLNAAQADWGDHAKFGSGCGFEGDVRFEQYGINVHVINPGQPNCHYHGEDDQEDFLVIEGQCKLLIEGHEIPLSAGDFVHCPKWARHVFVGAGQGPCTLVMTGGRSGHGVQYPVIPLSQKYNASPAAETLSPKESYKDAGTWNLSKAPASLWFNR